MEVLPGSEWNSQIKKDNFPTDKIQSKIKLLQNFHSNVQYVAKSIDTYKKKSLYI
jgi:hypothetical protein